MRVVLILFVTGFTKLYFNKLLELLSSNCVVWTTLLGRLISEVSPE